MTTVMRKAGHPSDLQREAHKRAVERQPELWQRVKQTREIKRQREVQERKRQRELRRARDRARGRDRGGFER